MTRLLLVLPESGRILIDNIDISKVDTHALRTRVVRFQTTFLCSTSPQLSFYIRFMGLTWAQTFLAQDPVLFPGSMRQNLDPLDEYSDDACDAVLRRICSAHQWTLEMQIDTGGRNLSQGQRQLVGLARAILRRSAIVILDEVTSPISARSSHRSIHSP